MRPDGSDVRLSHELEPWLAANGTRVFILVHRSRPGRFSVLDVVGFEIRRQGRLQWRMRLKRSLAPGCGRTGDVWPQLSPDGKLVVYPDKGTVWSTFTLPPPRLTRDRGRLTHNRAIESNPVWSPDNHTIAFGGTDGAIRIVDTNNGRPRLISRRAYAVAGSPDGRHLALVENGLYLTNLRCDVIRQLAKAPVGGLFDVAWAPGPNIVFPKKNGDPTQDKCGD
jgi:Tol biopolymer transport system component